MRHLLIVIALLIPFQNFGSWGELNSGETDNINGLFFLNDNVGYIGGGRWDPFGSGNNSFVKKTTDGGKT